MHMKIHETRKGRIVAACDTELLGKILDNGKIHLDLIAHRDFYEGTRVSPQELKAALKSFSSANLIGKKAVGVAVEMDLAGEGAVMYINKTPHIQLYKL